MVAITVILAAVIAAFVLDMGQSQNAPVNAATSVDNGTDTLTVQLTDAGNADNVYVKSAGNIAGCSSDDPSGATTDAPNDKCNLKSVGDTATLKDNTASGTVIGVKDGEETVLQNIN